MGIVLRRIHVGIIVKNAVRDLALWRARRKKHSSWGAACQAAKATYEADYVTAFRIERSRGILGKEEEYLRPSQELMSIERNGVFVDFGGSAGELLAVLQRRSTAASFVVVETPVMVKAAAALRPLITFSCELPDHIDVFHSSGTFQYLEDPYALWEQALRKTTGYAFLARNTFSEDEQFRVQHSMLFSNGAGPIPQGFKDGVVRYPHRTVSERRIIEAAAEAGFGLVKRISDRNAGQVQGAKDMYGADLLFKRIR
jgi:putative methyltransferase (TIGR04325 family)